MSALNDLIRIKTSKQEDDLLKMLDEIPVYEKLSADEKLRDLTKSEVTRKKCPLLAAFADGKLYETILAELVSNIYLQIEGNIPNILITATDKTPKQQKQMEILQNGIVRVEYRDLTEYDHESMKDLLAAVFTKNIQDAVTAVLIVRESRGYKMYHGTYTAKDANKSDKSVSTPLIVKGKHGVFIMNSYSVLGNNGYRFGSYKDQYATYDVMIGPDGILYLINGDSVIPYSIPTHEQNILNMAKKDPQEFAEMVTSIIESVV